MHLLAMVYLIRQKPTQAENLLVEAVRCLRREHGAENPNLLIAMCDLATIYGTTGRLSEAETLGRDVLQVKRRILGDEHPETLISMVLLGEFLLSAGRHDEAERLFLEALRGCRKSLDHNHDTTEAALGGPDRPLHRQGGFQEGRTLIASKVCEITRSRWGADHEMTAKADYTAGMILFLQKEYSKAEPYLRDCLAWYIRTNPEGLARFATESWLGMCLRVQKKYAEAESRLLSAYSGLKARQESLSPEHEGNLRKIIAQLIQLYDALGRGDKAEEWQRLRADLDFPADPFVAP